LRFCGRGKIVYGFAHWSSLSYKKKRRPLGARPRIWVQSWMPWSHSGVDFCRMSVEAGKACVCKGQPSSSIWMGMSEEIDVEIRFPYQISGPPVRWRSAISRVAMLRAITCLHAGVLSLRVWKAISMGQWRNLEDACCSEARAVPPRAPASFRSYVQERTDAPQ